MESPPLAKKTKKIRYNEVKRAAGEKFFTNRGGLINLRGGLQEPPLGGSFQILDNLHYYRIWYLQADTAYCFVQVLFSVFSQVSVRFFQNNSLHDSDEHRMHWL